MTKLEPKVYEKLRKQYVDYHLKEITAELYRTIDDPNFSIAAILDKLEELKKDLTAKEYIDFRMKIHQLAHGVKSSLSIETQANINISFGDNKLPKEKIIDVSGYTNREATANIDPDVS